MSDSTNRWPDAVHQSGRATAAYHFGWSIHELSIQGAKASDTCRLGYCRLDTEPACATEDDVLKWIIYAAAGTAAEYLLAVEGDVALTGAVSEECLRYAALVFPAQRKWQAKLIQVGQDTALDLVRRNRHAVEVLAKALLRLEMLSGRTVYPMLRAHCRLAQPGADAGKALLSGPQSALSIHVARLQQEFPRSPAFLGANACNQPTNSGEEPK